MCRLFLAILPLLALHTQAQCPIAIIADVPTSSNVDPAELHAALLEAQQVVQFGIKSGTDARVKAKAKLLQDLQTGRQIVDRIGINGDIDRLTHGIRQVGEKYWQWQTNLNTGILTEYALLSERVNAKLVTALRVTDGQRQRLEKITLPLTQVDLAMETLTARVRAAIFQTIRNFGDVGRSLQRSQFSWYTDDLQPGLQALYDLMGKTIEMNVQDLFDSSYAFHEKVQKSYSALLVRLAAGEDIDSILGDLEKSAFRG